MICPKCGIENVNGVQFCKQCGQTFAVQPQNQQNYQPPPQTTPTVIYSSYPSPSYPAYSRPMRKAYTWKDICTIVGFCSSIVGIFTFWLVLCPVALASSIVGFRGDRTKGLAVAGIIISILAILVKIGSILYNNNILPHWLTSGVFW